MLEEYRIIRSNRKTIAIQIQPDGQILVRCPKGMRSSDVHTFVESKRKWIDKQLSKIKPQSSTPLSKEELDLLRDRSKVLVQERVAHYAYIMGVSYNHISLRFQRTRWGSCSSKGNLNFNCLLALVPPDVLDYVVVHELCHLKEMNHSQRFWEEVRSVMPDYEQSKRWLKENGNALISRIE